MGSHRSVRLVSHQTRVRKLGRVNIVRLMKMPPYSVSVVDGDTFTLGLAWIDGDVEGVSAVDTVYHVRFVKKC